MICEDLDIHETLSGIVYTLRMLTYIQLKARPRDFLSATGLTLTEFSQLLPAFEAAYATLYPSDLPCEGKPRQRRAGGGAKGVLPSAADKLLFILVYQKTNPLQTMHALQCGLRQPQTHYWIHRLLPVLQHALADMGLRPEREAHRVATSSLAWEGTPDLAIDGTERRRQRPTDPTLQKEHYSGKKKTHTDKNLLLVNETTGKVVYLGPTIAGKTHDKKAADEAALAYVTNATLDKDTGFQGYEPAGVLTRQPKKNRKAGS
jgi:DDE superfamily endonuclease